VAEYYQIRQQLDHLRGEIRDVVFTPKNILPYLNRGRLVQVKSDDGDWGWGAIVNFTKKPHPAMKGACG
jgi:ATP-dependent RNA helicase DOB1